MTRRKGPTHTLIRIDVDGSKAVPLPPSTCLLLCHRGALSFRRDGDTGALAAGDALLIEEEEATVLKIDGEARCYLASITTG